MLFYICYISFEDISIYFTYLNLVATYLQYYVSLFNLTYNFIIYRFFRNILLRLEIKKFDLFNFCA